MHKRVAIIGNGWVSKAMQQLFPDAYVYVRKLKSEHANTRYTDDRSLINDCDVAFICVPTPLGEDGRLDTSAVEDVLSWLTVPIVVIRSTVNPGDCDKWDSPERKIVFQPEYLGETPNHPLLDEKQTPFIILGATSEMARREVINLYTTVYNANVKIRSLSLLEAEIVKLSENRAIAFKVMQCQELYDSCEAAGVDYYTIRDAVYGDDPRFNLYWTFIYPDKRGFNSSKCLVKDVPAWCAWAESVGIKPTQTQLLCMLSNQYQSLDLIQ